MKLPPLVKVYEKSRDDQKVKCWNDIESMGKIMDYNTVVRLSVEGDKLDTIYINMDSSVLKTSTKTKIPAKQN